LDLLRTSLADRYRLERELGQGGMATVYLAEDLKHRRKVAIKVLRPELAAVIGAERFLREIQTIATLQHPHILGLIDSGEVRPSHPDPERSEGEGSQVTQLEILRRASPAQDDAPYFSRFIIFASPATMSTGRGKTMVVFFSTPISVRVCR